MAFAHDLLEQAEFLANREPAQAKQASLRRAVSTAYYALSSSDRRGGGELGYRPAAQCSCQNLRSREDEKRLRSSCHEFLQSRQSSCRCSIEKCGSDFGTLQQQRHIADYDNGFVWQRTDAVAQIDLAIAAFVDWSGIRGTDEAQDYLLALFLPRPPRV